MTANAALLSSESGRKLSARSIQFVHAVLRSALQHAVREELLGRNVAKLASPPRAEAVEISPLDIDDAKAFLAVASKHKLAALWLILVTTGLRRGEVLALTWSDIDLDLGWMRVRRTIQRLNGEFVYGEPKIRRSKRGIRLPVACIAALRAHQQAQLERAGHARWAPLPDQPAGLVFMTATGRPIDPRSINKALDRLLKRAGLTHSRVHDLRHTCATLLLDDGASGREVMELLGHSSIGITMNVYAHVLDDAKRRTAAKMDGLLND